MKHQIQIRKTESSLTLWTLRSWGVSLALLVLLGFGCSKKATNPNVLALVGSHPITIQDFQREMKWWEESRRPMPDKDALLEQMIRRELRLQKARAAGLENDPEVKRRYEIMLAGRIEELELRPALEQVKATPEDVRAAYEKEISRYSHPGKARLALICIKTDPKITPEKLAEAEARAIEARKAALALPAGSRGLATVAAEFSDDQASRYRGGDVGWFDQGRTDYRWPTEVVQAGLALSRVGEISEVVHAQDGFYIVSKTDLRQPVVTPLNQVQGPIERRVLVSKRQMTEDAFNQKLRAAAPVQTFPQALARVQYPTTALAGSDEPQPPLLQGASVSANGKPPLN